MSSRPVKRSWLGKIFLRRSFPRHEWRPVTLKPSSSGYRLPSPVGRRLSLLLRLAPPLGFTAIWCVMLRLDFSSMSNGKGPGLFFTLFKLPLYAFTAWMVLDSAYSLLRLFNPTVEATIAEPTLRLGETAGLRWKLKGGMREVRGLRVQLIGRESASYNRGTRRTTEHHEFHRLDIAFSSTVMRGAVGSASVAVPAGSMHSFHGVNNKIRWLVKFTGEISLWPDLDQDYELPVLPEEAA